MSERHIDMHFNGQTYNVTVRSSSGEELKREFDTLKDFLEFVREYDARER